MTPAYVIHLPKCTNRLQLIENLRAQINTPLQIFFASDGSATWNDLRVTKLHPRKNCLLTQGMVGCVESHMAILGLGGDAPFFVFEDDTEMRLPFQEVQDFIDSVEMRWDILVLGANEYVESEVVTESYRKIGRFWGTHAMLIHPRCCAQVLATFEEAKRAGVFLPADWMYNEAIRLKGLRVYGPTNPKEFFRQKPGLVSLITGNVR